MAKLKIITLVLTELPDGTWEYKAIDDDGRLISTRIECRSCLGTTYIAALITKNKNNCKFSYSIRSLFTGFHRISKKRTTESKRPYAIAVLDDHKEAFERWRTERRHARKQQKEVN